MSRGEKADVIVHRVVPRDSDAREARHEARPVAARIRRRLSAPAVGTVRKWELGTRRPSGAARTLIEVIKTEPKAVRRAIAKKNSAA